MIDVVNNGKSLSGKKVVITRPQSQSKSFITALKAQGAEPLCFPMIETKLTSDLNDLDKAIENIESYDWLVFTSINGVKYFLDRLGQLSFDVGDLKNLKICTVGPKTSAALNKRGIDVDLVPKDYVAEGLLVEFGEVKGKKFLLPRAKEAREILPDTIRAEGGIIDVVTTYETVKPKGVGDIKQEIEKEEIDFITFTSSSTVTNFLSLFDESEIEKVRNKFKVAVIGPVTKKTAISAGLTVDVMAEEYTIDGLVLAIEKYYKSSN